MIKIAGNIITPSILTNDYPENSLEADTIKKLAESKTVYKYPSLNHLKFQANMRANIVKASRELNKSRFKFKTFNESLCNPDFWERTDKGGFLLKENVKPSEAVRDIFKNGQKYGTECSTAIVILYLKAVLDIYPDELFDMTFMNLHLKNWQFVDSDLDIYSHKLETPDLPGDCRYFMNPDFNPEKSEWRGENAIYLGDGTYYGHGIGIKKPEDIIQSLNRNRKEGAEKTAFLTDSVTTPNYMHLANVYIDYASRKQLEYYRGYYAI